MKQEVVVITGGSNGIGRATIEILAKKQYIIYNLDTESPIPLDLASQMDIWLPCDVSVKQQLQNAISQILEKHGTIDCLFANAGIHHVSTIEEIAYEELVRLIDVNLIGTINTLQVTLPIMKEKNKGSIVLMGSDQSFVGKGSSSIYGATKAAIASLTKSTAIDYGSFNIRINCVCPGPIDTRIYRNALNCCAEQMHMTEKAAFQLSCSKQPLNRIGQPKEVAEVVAFLLSSASSFMTGSLIPIDGGYTAQ